MEEGDGTAAVGHYKTFVDGVDHFAAGGSEHDRLDVVPAAGEGIHPVVFPQFIKQLV